ncbi:MAG: Gfo/Idh/MocA family oxidoreductase [Thermotogaceae bacterium]|nr:Gfo/Idh/MocA family oxidoreductase [Thermotogaceae bacterium]
MGAGRIATKKHLEALLKNYEVFELVAICDLVEDKALHLSRLYYEKAGKKPEIATGASQLFKREDIDAVAIATSTDAHYPLTMEALESGKHVLLEKPMALSTKHMDDMIELSRRKNLKLAISFQNRFNPPVQELRKKIEGGDFGRIFYGVASIRWNRNEDYYKQAEWRGKWRSDGGVLMNQSTHNIDLLQWMLGGEVEEVYGHLENFNHPYIEVEDFGAAIIKFKNGAVGILEGTSVVYPRNLEETLSIFGEKGTVKLGGLAVNRIETWRFENEDSHPFMELPDPDTVYGFGHIPLYKDFYEAIDQDRDPAIPGEEGRKAVDIVLAIYKSYLTKKPVKFPFDFSAWEMEGKESW